MSETPSFTPVVGKRHRMRNGQISEGVLERASVSGFPFIYYVDQKTYDARGHRFIGAHHETDLVGLADPACEHDIDALTGAPRARGPFIEPNRVKATAYITIDSDGHMSISRAPSPRMPYDVAYIKVSIDVPRGTGVLDQFPMQLVAER